MRVCRYAALHSGAVIASRVVGRLSQTLRCFQETDAALRHDAALSFRRTQARH
jgi:hypothetical protein